MGGRGRGKGLMQQSQMYSVEKAKAVAWKGQECCGATAFAVLAADFASPLSLRDFLPTHLFP